MLLSEVFLPEFIKYDLKGITKNEIFEEMVDHFCHITRKNVKKDVLAALYERESLMSTGVLHGIAMPHGKTAAIDGIFGVLGVSRHGISYDSMDGRPVYLVFMLIAPPVKAETHLHIHLMCIKAVGLIEGVEPFWDEFGEPSYRFRVTEAGHRNLAYLGKRRLNERGPNGPQFSR